MVLLTDHVKHPSGRKKNICTSAVLAAFGIVPTEYRYAEHKDDVKRILRRKGWAVRSRLSRLPKRARTMSGLKRWLRKNGEYGARYYVGVPGHAILLSNMGSVLVDTANRRSDRRQVVHISAVFRGPA